MTTTLASPDLSLSVETNKFLARMLLDGGPNDYAHKNGHSQRVSEFLASKEQGFFDRTRYPDLEA
jgi:hypothetical protein